MNAKTAAPPVLDVEKVRADFPILTRTVYGRPLVYLDSAASSQKPRAVLDAMDDYYTHHHANVHRGVYAMAAEATELYEGARAAVARFVNAATPDEIVFTRGTTEAINLVVGSWGVSQLKAGDAILLTEMEHHANLVPWQLLAERLGLVLRFIPITGEGLLDLSVLDAVLDRAVKLVGFVHVSNSLGTVNPVAKLVEAARAVGAKVLLDAAQSVPHMPVDVRALGVDFMAFSGHKMAGPTGIGALWARREILADMPPWQGGGEMIRRVTLQRSTFADPPGRFEAGTPAIAEAVGLGAAVRYLEALGMPAVQAHDAALTDYALERLAEVPGVTIHGPREGRAAAVAFTLQGVHPHDLATILDRQGIAVRAGHHCTMPLHDRLGLTATTRASFYVYNTLAEVDALVAGLETARGVFGVG